MLDHDQFKTLIESIVKENETWFEYIACLMNRTISHMKIDKFTEII